MSGVAGRRHCSCWGAAGPRTGESSEAGESAALAADAASRDRHASSVARSFPRRRSQAAPIADGRAGSPRGRRAASRSDGVRQRPGDELSELHHVRYDGVPLLDRPDDVLQGRTMQELDGGDQVDVLERAEIWARVRTPHEPGRLGARA